MPYVHNQVAPGLGKIGVLVALESAAPAETLNDARQADRDARRGRAPAGADGGRAPSRLIERERSIAMEKAKESGKPQNIVEKMVEGGLAKFRKDNALPSQLFVMDGKTPVADVVAAAARSRHADQAEGLCPLPARRRHREEGRKTSQPKSPRLPADKAEPVA